MGGAVSSGRDNGELVDNLKGGNYIRTPRVEAAFRAVDRASYMPSDSRNLAYKDLAWKSGQLHLSAPCIYSEVMEGLELKEGLTFLNVGSGTGYLSTMVGLLLGPRGVNHGIEIHQVVLEYANKRLAEFLTKSPAVDEFHFCTPTFLHGNGLCLPPGSMRYDRVYCGAGCPEEFQSYFKQLIKVGGVLVMPLNDCLLQIRRESETEWTSRSLLNVSFAPLLVPSKEECSCYIQALSVSPESLQVTVRHVIRAALHGELLQRNPHLREPPARPLAPKKTNSRRICIPIEDDSDMELDGLHDLDRASGAGEMNALLSLVLSMGQNRVAGALHFDHTESFSDSDDSSSVDSVRSRSRSGSRNRSHSRSRNSPDLSDRIDNTSQRAQVQNEKRPESEVKSSDAPMSDTMDTISLDEPQGLHTHCATASRDGATSNAQETTSSTKETVLSTQETTSSPKENVSSTLDLPDGTNSGPSDEPQSSGTGDSMPVTQTGPLDSMPGTQSAEQTEECGGKTEDISKKEEEQSSRSGDSEGEQQWRRALRRKRDKLDSGFGEETSPRHRAASSSPEMVHLNHDPATCPRRVMKRSRPALSEDSSDSSEDSSCGAGSPPAPPRHKHKRAAAPDPCQLRRVRISQLLRASVASLPLPAPLQRYVNLDRDLP